ncbi:hypothetical protein AX774_g7866 [Zancudomyces culisetae]|uniref:Uncharacterized protein n=1 Tax=Zancudomyces culisetae TaxID=1213189 RepID=A0A1R1PCN0_ZANCU|nr:hypothetical protein AX774_g7866 [Zancudomyces culisetae]|eukprot:OMH78735.1 hypothetical protein AX774_g7866 [Zancudomyces culisetae]
MLSHIHYVPVIVDNNSNNNNNTCSGGVGASICQKTNVLLQQNAMQSAEIETRQAQAQHAHIHDLRQQQQQQQQQGMVFGQINNGVIEAPEQMMGQQLNNYSINSANGVNGVNGGQRVMAGVGAGAGGVVQQRLMSKRSFEDFEMQMNEGVVVDGRVSNVACHQNGVYGSVDTEMDLANGKRQRINPCSVLMN